ncbi:CLUMA_CG001855, isoform A [Clunio marinus]|uniref:CLUMA_CG001855, isoform A n=1 Tax=Clunio marinus TaxID=568069 RepID=A0A1J1HNM2_9DIPT|nr:CLUMA_CG001855, isoform A [Clunio marinus]
MKEKEILRLKPLITNVDIKVAAATDVSNDKRSQIICIVTEKDQIILRYVTETAEIILKKVDWFQENEKIIQDVAFDPSSVWLLVLCLDNTLHIVPALSICDKSISFKCNFASNEITSFIVPFIGPHECPNSQKCPNHVIDASQDILKRNGVRRVFINRFQREAEGKKEQFSTTAMEASTGSSESTMSSCPFPTAVIWGKTHLDENRAIIGYSDGCVVVVLLANNCPFIGNTIIEKSCIERFVMCKDSGMDTVTLMINTVTKEQYKILLEQKSTSYTFPSDTKNFDERRFQQRECESDWEAVSASGSSVDLQDSKESNESEATTSAASDLKSRLLSLRDLGARKIGNLKLKLAESRIKAAREKDKKNDQSQFSMLNSASIAPELLTTPSGPFFIVQKPNNKNLMSAFHPYSDTLSIHNIEIMMIPSSLYKLPAHTKNVLLTETVLYVHQNNSSTSVTMTESTPVISGSASSSCITTVGQSNSTTDLGTSATNSSQESDKLNKNESGDNFENVISVISCALTTTKIGDDCEFNERSILGSFKFPSHERVLNVFQMSSVVNSVNNEAGNAGDETHDQVEIKSTYSKYLNYQSKIKISNKFDDTDRKVLRNVFPRVIFDKCLIVTTHGVYCIEMKEKPHVTFLNLAASSSWGLCDDFCKTFNLNMTECVEFSGDIMLKKKKIEQALLIYNIARIPPIKTALKLAMFNETSALRQITAMALKISFILESKHPMSSLIEDLLKNVEERHEKCDVIVKCLRDKHSKKHENFGKIISDFSYSSNENNFEVQMSNSAQFHLSNLLFLTLCERSVKDKNLMPLWNFIVTNTKYHTSLSSIILSQSGLYSTAVLLAMHRGACLDVFSCLVSTADHVLDISNEMNVFMYNLSDGIFMETIIYLQNFGLDYFEVIRTNLDKFDETLLERLMNQLNPFDPIYRPILFKVKNQNIIKEVENKFLDFCKTLIETFILVLIKLQRLKCHKDNFLNSLNMFRVTSEERQNYVKLANFSPLSAGFSHSGCIVDNAVYLWGRNDVNCAMNRSVLQSDSSENDVLPTRVDFFKDVNLDVLSVHCGRSHTLFLTNNGLYSMGLNQLGQLGIDRNMNVALQPMLIKTLDNKTITQICAGQHHNAVVADGVLYTWGWNIYGQLGHGDIKNVREPKVVEFFKSMKIKQVALGQAHTIVLAYDKIDDINTSLYVFGSNHYGQLGIGFGCDDGDSKKNFTISSVPLKIRFEENIRLIHTQYFVNFAVTDSNKLKTWGLSPPELRIINQTKKRAKANQKLKESMQQDVKEETSTTYENSTNEVGENEVTTTAANIPEIKIDECANDDQQASTSSATTANGVEAVEDGIATSMEEYVGHLFPSEIDTYELDGEILHISSGIYHYALITSNSTLFMWGKNIERQLGRENVKPDISTPTRHLSLDDVKYVECGADFTLVVTAGNELKSFGNNNNGQCGVENIVDNKQTGVGKLIRFKSSKRVFRIPESTMYLHSPVTVKVPPSAQSPIINFSCNQPICYLKNLPKFKKSSIIESNLTKSLRKENIHSLDDNILNNNRNSFSSISSIASTASSSSKSSNDSSSEENDQQLMRSNDFVHYCLFLFQGLYETSHFYDKNMDKIVGSEYKIRGLMLNYNYIEAFKMALTNDGTNGAMSIKIFEYFTTDSNIIPMHTDDIKYFIYDVFIHFIHNHYDVGELEKYFLYNLDYYFLQLAFILYFCGTNNNSQPNGLEKQLFEKFKHLYNNYENFAYFDSNEIEAIFKSISTSFHCSLCQNILKYSENIN